MVAVGNREENSKENSGSFFSGGRKTVKPKATRENLEEMLERRRKSDEEKKKRNIREEIKGR